MYVLCKETPSPKKTPKVYEMNDNKICPACGCDVGRLMRINDRTSHVASDNLKFLLFCKDMRAWIWN